MMLRSLDVQVGLLHAPPCMHTASTLQAHRMHTACTSHVDLRALPPPPPCAGCNRQPAPRAAARRGGRRPRAVTAAPAAAARGGPSHQRAA
eukprot:scaffold8166_cov45-Phaeocystis_antarctica.AAC.1